MNSADHPSRSGRLRRWLPSLKRKEKAGSTTPEIKQGVKTEEDKVLPDSNVSKSVERGMPPEQQKRWPKGRFGISQEIREQRPPALPSKDQPASRQAEPSDWHRRDQRSENHREERYTDSSPYVDWEPGRSPPQRTDHHDESGKEPRREHSVKSRPGGDHRQRSPHPNRGTTSRSDSKRPVSPERRRGQRPNTQASSRTGNRRPHH